MIGFRRFATCVCVSLSITAVFGCATKDKNTPQVPWYNPHAHGETLTQTPDEHRREVAAIREHNRKALMDDLDLLFMTERRTRLTRWHDK